MSELEAKPEAIDYAGSQHPAQPDLRVGVRVKWLLRLGGIVLLGLVIFYVGKELRKSLLALRGKTIDVQWIYVAAGLMSLLGARLMNALNCRVLLSALGTVVPTRRVIPVIWISSLGRYMPGKVAVVAGSVGWLMKLGVRMPVAVTALFLSTALMILIGLVTATPLVFMSAEVQRELPFARAIAVGMLGVGLICLYPRIFLTICNAVLTWLKRPGLPRQMGTRQFWGAIGLTTMRSVLLGLGLWLAARSLGPVKLTDYPQAMASAGLASVIGFLAVFAPAGLGVHEMIYLNTMRPILGDKVAYLVLLFRALHVMADVVAAAVGAVMVKASGNEMSNESNT